ncbi:ribonucleoside-diphosphate reductase subunit alpha [Anaerococcus porci]|uniref:Ribonucleoside-diphosphate reductase n=1 Tax=Anaerococcus porci TaxID=2652269 RepID=A0A6N7VFA1_9FIRM|nr:ribonucleoside-diphosphate reductase subunit alpha [Anaerococcus porci]MDY3006574.1 ribonucleoside-diphosphate reductase subunit alpha [Anaerococcus porci]MSS77561.1 ribonucleoside-diphosphate reductase subunit alpha [Anaerococcus porci]
MEVKKRDGTLVEFEEEKIQRAIFKSFRSVGTSISDEKLKKISSNIRKIVKDKYPTDHIVTVEEIQDLVELELIENNFYKEVKSYILYRAKHTMDRKVISDFEKYIDDDYTLKIIKSINKEFDNQRYPIDSLFMKFESFTKANMTKESLLNALIKAASELTSKESPDWEFIAARFMIHLLDEKIKLSEEKYGIVDFRSKIQFLTAEGLYGKYIIENYTNKELEELGEYLNYERNKLFTYSGLDLVLKRYLIKTYDDEHIENVQEMFMGISMHLAIGEKNKVHFAKKLYDILSSLKATMATPTMTNARKPFNQLSSCFIDTVPDTLKGIYRSITNFAQVSKHGGGMGLYFGKVRAQGSDIRGIKNVAGGVIRWIKLANDTAVAVDQLGVRQGAVACYLDIWHKDVPEFLNLRTNNGDDRMKAHDIFPAVCVPDLFWKECRDNIDGDWYMFDPHEVLTKYGRSIEDSYGDDFEQFYKILVEDKDISKRVISIKDMIRLLIKSWTETGTPFVFNRDAVNKANPNKHQGMIYSSNLCTEIAQNMSPSETVSEEIITEEGEIVIVNKTKPGDFVECNLASLTLGNIDVNNKLELEEVVSTIVRALDNVIDLNYYPTPYAKVTNKKYRAIGLGTSGYHHMLVKNDIKWSEEEAHLDFVDRVYEDINYFAIKASNEIAKEKGPYKVFKGSDWDNGDYFTSRGYDSDRWIKLKKEVHETGLRNGYLLAIAPTGSTSIISGTSPGVDPIMNKYFLEEKKGAIVPRVAPGLNTKTFWLYENAYNIDQNISMKACGIRQRHIDQGQSVNIYITTDYTMRQILNIYLTAYEAGVKSLYYVRGKSLEVEDCESCAS